MNNEITMEDFIFSKQLVGDESYVTDEHLLLVKNKLFPDAIYGKHAKLLKKINGTRLKMENVPYTPGYEVEPPKTVELGGCLGLEMKFGGRFFNYYYIKIANRLLDIDHYTLVENEKPDFPWLLKFWDGEDNFLGCLAEIIHPKEDYENN